MTREAGPLLDPGVDPNRVESVARALQILKVVATWNDGGIRFSHLQSATGLSKGTLHRLLGTLMQEGFIEQHPATRLYHLGFAFLALGTATTNRFNMRNLARRSLLRLAKTTGDTVFLAVRSGLDAVFLDRVEGAYPIRTLSSSIGTRRPLGASAGALALLSYLPEDERRRVVQRNAKRAHEYAELDPERLFRAIEETRRLGYSVFDGTIVRGMSTVAVPVLNRQEEPFAAVSIVATADRMKRERRAQIVDLLRQEVEKIRQDMER